MSDMMSDITKTPREELECKKKYLYEHSMFWECNNGSKCQILEEDVCDLLNELNKDIEELGISIKLFEDDIATKDKKIEEQQATINKLRKILAEAEDTIEVRLAEHYLQEYKNIKHNIIGDTDE